MEEKINLVELLKDCPEGMELDCTVYDSCTLETVFKGCLYPIQIQTPAGLIYLTKYGSMSENTHSKCIIFPKGKNSWQGFQRPFKDGDILTNEYGKPFILKAYLPKINNVLSYCGIDTSDNFQKSSNNWTFAKTVRLATEEEKQKLFDIIKKEGYRWNSETKTLEKLQKFKVGDWVIDKQDIVHQIANVIENVINHTYDYDIVGGGYFNDNTEGVRLWTIQDAKDGDVLVGNYDNCKKPWIGIFKCISKDRPTTQFDSYCFINSSHHTFITPLSNGFYNPCKGHTIRYALPATQEQRDVLFQKMNESGYEWDAEKKELRKIEQKPAWSEEDEKKIHYLIVLVQNQTMHNPALRTANEELENWLKSLKDRCTWKPSDEQIIALRWVLNHVPYNKHKEEISGLLDQIKEL